MQLRNRNSPMITAERDWVNITKPESSPSLGRASDSSNLRKQLPTSLIQSTGNVSLLDVDVTQSTQFPTPKRGEESLSTLIPESSKKKAPPVPRKPIALAANRTPRAAHGTDLRNARAVVTSSEREKKQDRGSDQDYLKNPSRSGQHSTEKNIPSPELLDSDIDTGMCKWTPLQPRKES